MKKIVLLILISFVIVFGACSSAPAPEVLSEEIDLSRLGLEVDVQTVASIQDMEDVFIIDVREQWEYDEGHIPNITLIPMGEVPNRLSEIPTDKEVIVTCRSGNRSGQITDYLRQQGYDNVHNMTGGILAWEAAGLAVER